MMRLRATPGLRRSLGLVFGLAAPLALGGCAGTDAWLWILNPNGPIAEWSVYYLIVDVLLLLIIIVPATALTLWAAYKYRRGNGGTYDPSFNHSLLIEFVVWGVPLAVVVALSWFSYQGAYAVEPYNPTVLDDHPTAKASKPLNIDVVTTDWQWLFIYRDDDVALANKLVLPAKRQVNMRLTSASVTNDFYILKLVGQIYLMPGMRTKRKFLAERPGEYRGFSTEFSGPGFSWMDYPVDVVTQPKFKQWLAKAKQSGERLSYFRFRQFAEPTINIGRQTETFSGVQPNLFAIIIDDVKSGQLRRGHRARLTEDMQSTLFKQHSTE